MRWSTLPVSIVAHVAALVAVFIIPLAADLDLPPIAPANARMSFVVAAAVPGMSVGGPRRAAPSRAAPTAAASTISPERLEVPSVDEVPGALPSGDIGTSFAAPDGIADAPVPLPPAAAPQRRDPVRPGGIISEPKKLVHVAPIYPSIARDTRSEGIVVLEAIIDERGRVDRIRVLQSSPLLDDAAIQAVRQWRYTPTLLNGVPVPVLMTITVSFRLR